MKSRDRWTSVGILVALGMMSIGADCKRDDSTRPTPIPIPTTPPTTTPLPPAVALTADPGGPYQGLTDRNMTFSGARSTTPAPPVRSWFWDFGDGTPETNAGMTPTHRYAHPNPRGGRRTYTVRLRIVDSIGRTATGTTTAIISDIY